MNVAGASVGNVDLIALRAVEYLEGASAHPRVVPGFASLGIQGIDDVLRFGRPVLVESVESSGLKLGSQTRRAIDFALLIGRDHEAARGLLTTNNAAVSLLRVLQRPFSVVRSLVRVNAGPIFEVRIGSVQRDGLCTGFSYFTASPNGGGLVPVGKKIHPCMTPLPWSVDNLKGLQGARESTWRVSIGIERRAVEFWTDAIGARAVFAERDKRANRREALLHWVREHWRRRPRATSTDDLIRIAEHMRGAEAFRWAGLDCRIEISDPDRERLAMARAARAS